MVTAIDFLRRDESGVYNEQDIAHAMVEFAKLHCKEQAKVIMLKAKIIDHKPSFDNMKKYKKICPKSVSEAYPLENIK